MALCPENKATEDVVDLKRALSIESQHTALSVLVSAQGGSLCMKCSEGSTQSCSSAAMSYECCPVDHMMNNAERW